MLAEESQHKMKKKEKKRKKPKKSFGAQNSITDYSGPIFLSYAIPRALSTGLTIGTSMTTGCFPFLVFLLSVLTNERRVFYELWKPLDVTRSTRTPSLSFIDVTAVS